MSVFAIPPKTAALEKNHSGEPCLFLFGYRHKIVHHEMTNLLCVLTNHQIIPDIHF